MTIQEFWTALYRDVRNKNTDTLTVLKEITLRQLKELSLTRTTIMEASKTFSTVAGQETYTPGAGGLPADLLTIDRLWWTSGSTTSRYEIPGPQPMDDVRFAYGGPSAQYPSAWGWEAGKLVLAPPPAAVVALGIDYMRDATLDTATGTVLTTTSTTQTNPWFDRGELALRNAVLAEYFSMPAWRDQEAAAFARVQKDQALAQLKAEARARKDRGGQAPMCWGDEVPEGSYAWP